MDEIWKKTIDIYFSRGFWAAAKYVEGLGFSFDEAIVQVQGALKIYHGTNGQIHTGRSDNGRPVAAWQTPVDFGTDRSE